MYVEDPWSNVIEKSNTSGTVKGEVKVNKVEGGKLDEGWELDRLELLVHSYNHKEQIYLYVNGTRIKSYLVGRLFPYCLDPL